MPGRRPGRRAGGRRRHPGRAQRGRAARRGRAAVLPRRRRAARRRRTRCAASRPRSRPTRSSGWSSSHVEPRDPAAPRSRDWIPRLRVGDPRRQQRDHRGVGGRGRRSAARCSSRSAAGRRRSASCTRASTSAGASSTPAGGSATRATSSSCTRRQPGDRARVFVLFRCAQPSVARAPPPAAAAGRPLRDAPSRCARVPRLKSRRALQEAARGYRDGMRGPGTGRSRLQGRTLLRMTRAGRPPIM